MMDEYGSTMGSTWLFWLLLVIGIVLLAILAVRFFSGRITRPGPGRGPGAGPGPDGPGAMGATAARRILDERYAKGELSAEEYRERLRVLGDEA
ncbi:SHOCT domain-containing protein [Arthrobacter sp. PAMC25284]|uniref:SHOCT domain-containing protein n=1 Tax=Arthrobacter sp. PAMC25284 TaxID=2861279 RepID=UPI001C6358CA|nr:SHOCT domain-containing protein [Arthrobacter sp. PAMC25284]QYF90507.1 SHOCT domain-containing protein [Arthrobacter sp. PAMC25284]